MKIEQLNRLGNLTPFLVAVFSLITILSGCSSTTPTPTLDGIWSDYKQAYRQYHGNLYQFGSKQWPEYKEALNRQREYELTRLQLRDHRFRFLRQHHSGELPTKYEIHDLVHFEWPSRFDTELIEVRPEVEGLRERVKKLRGELHSNNEWSTIRDRFQSLPRDSRYFEINKQLQQELERLNEQLDRWRTQRQS